MAGHSHFRLPAEEPGDFAQKSLPVARAAKGAAVVGLLGAVGLSLPRESRPPAVTSMFGFTALRASYERASRSTKSPGDLAEPSSLNWGRQK